MTMKSDRRKGSTMIEFAIVLLPLLALIFGSIEMDRMLLAYNALDNAARAGVRYAIVHGNYYSGTPSVNNVGKVVRVFANMGIIDSSSMTITESCAAITSSENSAIHVCYGDPTTATPQHDGHAIGSTVSVMVAHAYTPFTTFFPFHLTLGSTAQGTIAY
jgi:Flp pilus assembly protein TadG